MQRFIICSVFVPGGRLTNQRPEISTMSAFFRQVLSGLMLHVVLILKFIQDLRPKCSLSHLFVFSFSLLSLFGFQDFNSFLRQHEQAFLSLPRRQVPSRDVLERTYAMCLCPEEGSQTIPKPTASAMCDFVEYMAWWHRQSEVYVSRRLNGLGLYVLMLVSWKGLVTKVHFWLSSEIFLCETVSRGCILFLFFSASNERDMCP